MEKIQVTYNNGKIPAYRYAPSVLLVNAHLLPDSDTTIITDMEGYRYKRAITGYANEVLFRFDRI